MLRHLNGLYLLIQGTVLNCGQWVNPQIVDFERVGDGHCILESFRQTALRYLVEKIGYCGLSTSGH